ncbi:origin recognition complex subunit 5 C-terminus-domain-containing protein [Flammula alnicola]|nr:origin recognition complex subunit 5 C-terminus-domain-containing protein [Flammula alnicola]
MGDVTCGFPGYEHFCYELGTLLSMHPPHFIYIQDTETTRTTSTVVDTVLRDLSKAPPSSNPFKICYARVDSISCFTSRLFYETIINALVGWEPSWEDGCGNWNADIDVRWNENMDTFLHGLRAAHLHLCRRNGISPSSADKGKGKEGGHQDVRLVVVVERAERLKESLPELLVPLARLAELSRLDLSVIFISQVGWEDIRPPLGASPDPYYMDIQSPSKDDIARNLISNFSMLSESFPSNNILTNPYHPALKSLYTHFITVLCDVCFPFTHNPQELQYIAAARWPGFSKPLVDEHKRKMAEHNHDEESDVDMDGDEPAGGLEFAPPSDDIRMRLNRLFNPTLTTALEALLPRLTNAADWALANEPPAGLLSLPRTHTLQASSAPGRDEAGMRALPRMSKFILLASFLASTNPPKSDVRMFGRGLDEKKRRRRVTKATGKTKGGGPAKVPQRLLGPAPFALDRMVAILGALLEENDVDSRLLAREFTIPGEYTDMEIGRVGIFSSVVELTSMRLLHRTSPTDRLDGPPMFKCAISYETVLTLAKQLDVALNDLLWDPV